MFKILASVLIIIALAVPVIAMVLFTVKTRNALGWWAGGLLGSMALCYVTVLGSVYSHQQHLIEVMNSFDLDGDGVFSGDEITPEAEAATANVTNDTGVIFAPITASIYAVVYCGFWMTVAVGIRWLYRKIRSLRGAKEGANAA
jgi:hypothetical protein